MNQIIFYTQIISAIVLTILVVLQQRGTALGSAFGGSGGEFYASRRGIQKKMHYATITTAGIFIVLSILNLAL